MRLDCFIAQHWEGISRQKAIELIKQGQVRVNNAVVRKPAFCVQDSDDIVMEQEFFIESAIFCSRAALKLQRFLHNESKDSCLFLFCAPSLFDSPHTLLYHHLTKYIPLDNLSEIDKKGGAHELRDTSESAQAKIHHIKQCLYNTPALFKQILRSMIQGSVALDVGASAGGFTQVLLAHGARLVIAQDVGSLQLSEVLRARDDVLSFENVDIRIFADTFTTYCADIESRLREMGYALPKPRAIEFLVCDVSFISLELILPHLMKLADSMLLLFKPQYEVGAHAKRNKKGVLQNQAEVRARLHEFLELVKSMGAHFLCVEQSLLAGKEGNEEFFIFCQF